MNFFKNISWTMLLVALFASFMAGCDKGNQTTATNAQNEVALLTQDASFKEKGTTAVCLSTVQLREKPDANGKWIKSLTPGLPVNYLNKTENGPVYKNNAGEWVNGNWFYIETPDNDKGWVLGDLVAENATPAAIIEETATYTMPSNVSLSKEKLKPMDAIVIVGEKDGGWVKVIKMLGPKSKSFWIKSASMSKEDTDFAVALLFGRDTAVYMQANEKDAKSAKDTYITALNTIKTMAGPSSIFVGILDKTLTDLGAAPAVQQQEPQQEPQQQPADDDSTTATEEENTETNPNENAGG